MEGRKSMKIVVTGALGHIGSYLIEQLPLHFEQCHLILIDNMMTQRYCSLMNLPNDTSTKFIEGDVLKLNLEKIFENVDLVLHLAAITDATASILDPHKVEDNNYNCTKRIAAACIATSTPMIMISSTSVYGSQSEVVDEMCPEADLRPQSPYAETKLKEERLIKMLAKDHSLRALIFRFGTIFGVSAGMRFHTAVNRFCWQASFGQQLTVWETALHQKRPYLGLQDALNAILIASRNLEFDGSIFNVVSENATVHKIISEIQKYVPDCQVSYTKSPIMNQLSYEVLNTKLSNHGFIPQSRLENGVEETIRCLFRQA